MSIFELGLVTATPGAIELIGSVSLAELLSRHARGDWGDLDAADKKANENALKSGSRLLSSYNAGSKKLWIITDAETDVCPACWAGIGVCEPEKGEWAGDTHFRTDKPLRRLTTTILTPDEY